MRELCQREEGERAATRYPRTEPKTLLGPNKKPQAQIHHTEKVISVEERKTKTKRMFGTSFMSP